MAPMEHRPGCILDPVHWLRHAIGAANHLLSDDPDPRADRVSARSLLETMERHAELDNGWASVTMLELAQEATLMDDERFAAMCTCGAGKP